MCVNIYSKYVLMCENDVKHHKPAIRGVKHHESAILKYYVHM